MQILSLPAMTNAASCPGGGVWVLGFFDGVHVGHQALLQAAKNIAAANDTFVGVWTFSSLPKAQVLLTDPMERTRLLATHGCQYLAMESFSAVSHLSGAEFCQDILYTCIRPMALVCGFNFRFGYRGSSTSDDLLKWGKEVGIPVQVIEPCCMEGITRPVSSTWIRSLVQNGDMELATKLLTRPYSITGIVCHGKALGRTLGFPTANLHLPEKKCAPARGVYASLVTFDEQTYMGVCNIGYRPTVNCDRSDVTVETWLLDYEGDLYNKTITVSLCRKIREEKRFDALSALQEQVCRDGETVRKYFRKTGDTAEPWGLAQKCNP